MPLLGLEREETGQKPGFETGAGPAHTEQIMARREVAAEVETRFLVFSGRWMMHGRVVVITGANRGIGRETALALAKQGATVVMACRSLDRALPVAEEIKGQSGNSMVDVMQIDVASLQSIRAFAAEFAAHYDRLDALINNAGIFSPGRRETQDGLERTMATNYFGPFLLTHLLLPVLQRTPGARIVNVASAMAFRGRIDLRDLQIKRWYNGVRAYAASKLALVLLTQELAERLQGSGVTVNALHPGLVNTGIWKSDGWYMFLADWFQKFSSISPREGAQTSIYLASSDEVEGITGRYFDEKQPRDLPLKFHDAQLQKRLYEVSAELTGVTPL
jgi:NAD(P)-dependent dehydrogenase (short-subunit alcohol dehydrogenase family)